MTSVSSDGYLIIWDTNKSNHKIYKKIIIEKIKKFLLFYRLSYVNSIKIQNQSIYKVSISETTNDIAFITAQPNKLYYYTGNCELIGVRETNSNENVTMKSLCFSNATEGLSVNVIAVGLSNGKINLYSTWDLTLLREIIFSFDSTNVGCIISLTYTKDCKRLYVSDTYAKIYILESPNSPTAIAKTQQTIFSSPVSNSSQSSNLSPPQTPSSSFNPPINFLSNLICF